MAACLNALDKRRRARSRTGQVAATADDTQQLRHYERSEARGAGADVGRDWLDDHVTSPRTIHRA